ncbi:helix-turn-helix domain-containing protein [Gordonibacter massiliensis (ex Traore et al. 2017)]|uniref:Helix-turn-helix transcriptional regulator n=1 Tax=Gordonibacter massiliensis (ex Traore et al. 2017) TaxID=1841863 RepID=A0A842JJZ8_9ACTN|nr:helix-turn-helix domain-containing protein [Gordonibacter massiliensis (ex Traore et al. 2017)]MBC2890055.1 helix-turn-helix transcriptional regulator [Gordonibacter massiliensis (ex Traore et al. 2017)]
MEWSNVYSLKQLGDFLKQRRKARGISQADYAEMIGVSHATLSSLENGKPVSSETVMKAISYLGLNLVAVPKTAQTTVRLASDDEREDGGHVR